MHTTLISVQQLKDLQTSGKAFMVFDCTGDLMKPEMADTLFCHGSHSGCTASSLRSQPQHARFFGRQWRQASAALA
jgi:hypothetical protein